MAYADDNPPLTFKIKILMRTIDDLGLVAIEESPIEIGVFNKKWRNLASFHDNEDHLQCIPLDDGFEQLRVHWSDPTIFKKAEKWLEEYVKYREEVMHGKW